ncbi:MAG: HlyD family type I secretion periplasmic adaptor subunit [Leptolyngbyaceae cyanobacterium HOT.MB2.61]|nr:HlyD family type I secretion periplasmic adaptor subunit [Leptolyngbyaceae cyanobacterium HOT.MB2.61]
MLLAPKSKPRNLVSQPQVVSTKTDQWSPALQTVLEHPPATLPTRLALGGTAFFLICATWAWFGHIDQTAKASGKLIPKDEVFKVQPVESGKIITVAVKEGQTVKAGQVLMELDTEIASKEVERLQEQLNAHHTELNQVQTLLNKTQLQAQTKAAIAETEIQAQKVAVAEAEATADSNEALLSQLEEDAAAQRVRLERLQSLRDEGAISQESLFEVEQRLRDRQRTITESRGNLKRTLAEVNRLEVGLNQKQTEAQQVQLEAQQQVQQLAMRVSELQSKIKETQLLLDAAKAKLKQHFLYAPVDGVVLSLNVRQSGEVVQPKQTLAEIAPEGKPLVLSALLPNQEAGFVKTGMPVQVKLDAYPYQDYGVVPGQVAFISSDSKSDSQLGQVYQVEVALSRSSINARGQTIQFRPWQTATAEIVTRRRRIADVLLDPLKKLRGSINL